MIDSELIIRYTNGLYATHPDNSPTYNEFRDMFSSGQIYSKEWAIREIFNLGILKHQSVIVVGGWFGTLGIMLKNKFPLIDIKFLDIDPRCEIYLKNIGANAITQDMYNYVYTEDVVINTSCEHITDIRGWLDKLPQDTIVVLQSNNFDSIPEHVSCVFSEEQFRIQTNLTHVLYSGKIVTPMYTRYMIIGRT